MKVAALLAIEQQLIVVRSDAYGSRVASLDHPFFARSGCSPVSISTFKSSTDTERY
jgi:hypothetical protein